MRLYIFLTMIFILIFFISRFAFSQSIPVQTKEAIIKTCLNYVEGWYLGSKERISKALHPKLVKRKPLINNGEIELRKTTTESLISNAKPRGLASDQKIKVIIYNVYNNMTMA